MMGFDIIAAGMLHNEPPPHGFVIDIVEKDDEPGCVYLRLYADDVLDHPESEVENLRDWLKSMLDRLNQWTTGTWTWEMAEKPK